MRNVIVLCIMLLVALSTSLPVHAKSVTVRIAGQGLVAGTSERGTYFVVSLAVPEEVIGMRLDAVILEFYADVAADESIESDYSSSIEVFALSSPYQTGRNPAFAMLHATSRPVAIGERQRVTVDIADIVKSWIAAPSSNHGLVIGSFSGPILGALEMRTDVLDGGNAIQATFFYQNRFGQRLSQE